MKRKVCFVLTGLFLLLLITNVNAQQRTITVYIEGDDLIWTSSVSKTVQVKVSAAQDQFFLEFTMLNLPSGYGVQYDFVGVYGATSDWRSGMSAVLGQNHHYSEYITFYNYSDSIDVVFRKRGNVSYVDEIKDNISEITTRYMACK